MNPEYNRLRDSLHLFMLTGFAFAQPLFDLLSRNAEFFVARRSEPTDILLLVLVLSFVLPALVMLAEAMVFSAKCRKALHGFLTAVLVAVILLPILKRCHRIPGTLQLAASIVLSIGFLLCYLRYRPVRMFLTLLAPTVLIFPALFLINPHIGKLVWTATTRETHPVAVEATTPVVVIVFDEFPLLSLLDEHRQIDAARYPHFAALARDAVWFRNATTVHSQTMQAVPAILTGNYPDSSRLPILADHPHNLFTLLEGSYDFQVQESATRLCPERLTANGSSRPKWTQRMGSLLSDLAVVQLHLLLPNSFTADLPSINTGWKDFAACGCCTPAGVGPDRAQLFRQFVNAVHPSPRPTLYFLHVLLPHSPFSFLPSGKHYGGDSGLAGLSLWGIWTHENEPVDLAHQRHLLQVGFVDTLLGKLLARLKEVDLYDRSLIVVTADHGCSFRPGDSQREVSATNYPDILRVPLFIKPPNQRRSVVSDRNVQTIDILPTIADLLSIRLPWRVDGRSALDPSQPEWPEKIIHDQGRRLIFGPTLNDNYGGLIRASGHDLPSSPVSGGEGLGVRGVLRASDPLTPNPSPPKRGRGEKELIGLSTKQASVGGNAGVQVRLENADSYTNVTPDSSFVPCYVKGTVVLPQDTAGPLNLAIAVNGTIQAVTRSWDHKGNTGKWSVMVPEAAFIEGPNEIAVFVIARGDDGQLRLKKTKNESQGASSSYILTGATGKRGEALIAPDGRRIPVIAKAVQGCLDRVDQEGGCYVFTGWAAEVKNAQLAEAVAVFADGQFLHAGPTNIDRPDVANVYGIPALQSAGFTFCFPAERFRDLDHVQVRFFALSKKGTATELIYPEWYKKQALRPFR